MITAMLDNNSPIPLYYQLKSYIEDQINSGEWQPGKQIPSESELSELFKISRTTVRQAIGELVTQGKLVRTQGRGTFVTQFMFIDKPVFRLTGFSQEMHERGLKPSSTVLQLEAIPAPPHIIRRLLLKENEPAILLKRLRKANNEVMAIDICYLPHNRFIGLLDEDLEHSSLYEILPNKYKTIPTRSTRSLEAIACQQAEADLLNIRAGSPVLLMINTNYDQNERPFEYTESYYRGDRYVFNIEIFNQPDNE